MSFKKPNIKQVAQAAGVSTQTVSRVLNNRPDVAPQTRQRVQETIARLGYSPSALARSMIRQRSYTIGVVTAGLRFIGPSRTLTAIAAEADRVGYTLLLKELPHFDMADVNAILQSLLDRQVDGLIWAVPEVGENRAWLASQRPLPIPAVALSMENASSISVVRLDNRAGASLATRHLIEQGYQKIGHLAGPQDWWEAQERLAGWRDALLSTGLPAPDSHWIEGNWSSQSGYQAALDLLQRAPDIDAVFAGNDQMALSLLLAARQLGRQIPSDLGVVGFDNIDEAAYFNPPLTTVVQDHRAIGRAAVELLLRHIHASQTGSSSDPEYETIVLLPALKLRQSSQRGPDFA